MPWSPLWDYGGRAMAAQLDAKSIAFEQLPCQSLCPHAPIARIEFDDGHNTGIYTFTQLSNEIL